MTSISNKKLLQCVAAVGAAFAVQAAGAAEVVRAATAGTKMLVANNATDQMFAIDVTTLSASALGATGVDVGFGGLGFANNGTLYGFNSGNAGLYTVNTRSGAWTLVGAGGMSCGDTFDISPLNGTAYVVNICSGTLDRVDLATGASSLAATLTGWSMSAGSAFGEDGSLYFMDIGGASVRRTDVLTGVTNVVGNTGISPGVLTNLAYNPDDDQLYAVGLNNGTLYRFNPLTGAGASLGLIGGLPTGGQITMSTFQIAAVEQGVPEPTSAALVLAALAAAATAARRRRA